MADFVSQALDNSAHGLTTTKAAEKLGLSHVQELVSGMEVKLLEHQLVGVAWMIDQERDSPHKGGILADDMGLGKTVQMIATMVINQPLPEDKHRATLIVVPAALLQQWKEELETKTNCAFDIHIQHGKDKIKDPRQLAEWDVVITTYQTLTGDFNIPAGIEEGGEVDWVKQHGGPMSQVKWYRVVCDEAQFIRNRSTRSSMIVAMLRANYRWCLTGTPVTNTLADIYGYLRFGRFRPWNDWQDFNEYVAKMQLEDAPLAGMRAQQILRPLLLRRTKEGKKEDGSPLLDLPPKQVDLEYLQFSDDERALYDQFEKQAQVQINRFIRNNTLLKNSHHVLVLILRLRQLCAHPHLILESAQGFDDPTMIMGSEMEKEVSRATATMGAPWVRNIKDRYLQRACALDFDWDDDESDAAMCCKCGDLLVESTGRIMGCGDEICVDCVDDLRTGNIEHNGEFGGHDEKTNARLEKQFETAAAKGLRPCPKCKKMQDLRPNNIFRAAAFAPSQEDINRARRNRRSRPVKRRKVVSESESESEEDVKPQRKSSGKPVKKEIDIINLSDSDSDDSMPDISTLLKSSPKSQGKDKKKAKVEDTDENMSGSDVDAPKRNGKGKAKAKRKPSSTPRPSQQAGSRKPSGTPAPPKPPSDEMVAIWRRGGSNVEPSTKMLALVEYLKTWAADRPDDKVIVFSQWTSMLDLCEQLFARYGIRNLRYDGQMGREAREYTLSQFKRRGGPKVILVSIRCGGVGLNLVAANRVINLDLSWNYAAESQAYDRVHRLGQDKEVVVKRLVVHGTIEERMLTLQDTKLGLAEAALGEGSGTRLQKLSVKQIKDLFGMSSINKNPQDPNQTQLDL
ncbi:SNF2 family N-terminal domain-containing protein [Epithele typhae]|uniref:SNF2 family N-terminal domain-containing protein n=1 Tax=Epithele typhae TaxID=378194 RepID=UPI00200883C6|nr:SNF2 family N-terminal domain-containing protein [Epithele typhae]KAH9925655.1 SNF2 family N-terminal domain-containing protein [Epithele typhae]